MLRPALGDVGLLLHGLVARLGLRGLPVVGRLAGGGELGRQLALVWPGVSPAQFAGLKVLWGAVGTVAVVAFALAAATLADGASPAAWPAWAWPLVFGVPFLVPDVELARRLAQRREAVLRELPTALELLTLATTAGEGLEQALQLVATRAEGVVAGALRATLQDAAVGGRPLGAALEAMAAREGVAELATVAGHLRAVQEQGLPLASSLAALADGVRERKRVRLQAAGGRATVRMLVPIAVLILPVLAVVLIYPALAEIWGSLGEGGARGRCGRPPRGALARRPGRAGAGRACGGADGAPRRPGAGPRGETRQGTPKTVRWPTQRTTQWPTGTGGTR